MAKRNLTPIDGATFVSQLSSLSETIALKVHREGHQHLAAPQYVFDDLFVQLRYAQQAYVFAIYLNTDERRKSDCDWKEQRSVMGLPAIRTLIDCLYNITLILEDPVKNGQLFRLSGLRKFLLNLEQDQLNYGSIPSWQPYLTMRAKLADRIAAEIGITVDAIRGGSHRWDTLGRYLQRSYNHSNEHQEFLRRLTLGSWGDYSALAHATFEGMIPHSLYFVGDIVPQDQRPSIRENFLPFITMHIGRAAGVLLALLTEVQVRFKFDGARIDERILELWDALLPLYEIQEFYDTRYKKLMTKHGIVRHQ